MSLPQADAVTSDPQAVLMSLPQADAVTSDPQAVLMSLPQAEAVTSDPQAVLMSEPHAVAITFCAILVAKKLSFSFHALNFIFFTLNFNKSLYIFYLILF